MSEEFKEVIYDIATGETTERLYTKKEIDEIMKERAKNAVALQEILAKENLKKSANEKLLALGLTEEEIQAFRG